MRGHLLAVAAAPVAVLLATLLLLLAQRGLAHGTGTDLPLVAVLTTPLLSTDKRITALDLVAGTASANVTSCFTGYYDSWIKSAGGRTVPLRYDAPRGEIRRILSSVNAVLFTGGEVKLKGDGQSPEDALYVDTAQFIYDAVVAFNQGGDFLPLWGTCMGFQTISIVASRNASVLELNGFDSESLSLPLDLTAAAGSSPFISSLSPDVRANLATKNITSNLHHDGVTPAAFAGTNLFTSFNVLSTNVDRKGKKFVSTIEHRSLPIAATQWHPERPQFEFKAGTGINHSATAVSAMQEVANYFVGLARQSSHSFDSEAEMLRSLIFNTPPVWMGNSELVYLFAPQAEGSNHTSG